MRARNGANAIKYLLKSDGTHTTSLQEIHLLAQSYYSNFLSRIRVELCPFFKDYLARICSLHWYEINRSVLIAHVGSDQISKALLKLPLNKTPGPDGLTAEFYRAAWIFLGTEVISAIQDFFSSSFMPTPLNSTMLVLISKLQGSEDIKDFWPISCCNTLYKIISQILSDKLKRILPSIVVPNETVFVKDRLLLENVLLASEVLQG